MSLPSGRPRRRAVLAAGAAGALAGALAGCTGDGAERRARRDAVERGAELRREAAGQSAALLERYRATAATHPALADRLAPLREHVTRHLDAFGGHRATGTAQGTGTARGADPARTPTGPVPVPGEERAALRALADAERGTARARTRALPGAPPELARLLASVAAAGEVHAYLLGEA
ncbi:hypothetical protein WDH52_00165 [Streptomyces sp. TRM70308]|uniref:hypothetical protein n=1 Tax=Streptomyces sp. TRM70308 TaxID=3131932 RepID=UPI003D05D9BF